jgi:uncharacterized protein YciI
MPQFLMTCLDKPNALELRMATREAHLAYVGARLTTVKIAGPVLTEAGEMAGSMFILEAADIGAVRAFNEADPYTQAGLFERVEIRPIKVTVGSL